ncbi:uncharacterized protein V1518DRAFT_151876 [Limtongia smithiae]|uniref:uncharacterized protein n=1 Tax=Limtongia smithiae TaxID=1125753 RepID=UPI0034CD5B6E
MQSSFTSSARRRGLYIPTPTSVLLSSASVAAKAAFSPAVAMADALPVATNAVRRSSAAPPPNPELLQSAIQMVDFNSSEGSNDSINAKLASMPPSTPSISGNLLVPDSVPASASFTNYFNGPISTISANRIIAVSFALVASIVCLTSVQQSLRLAALPYSLGVSIVAAIALRWFVPARVLMSSSSFSTSNTVGNRIPVAAVFADRPRLYRALALGLVQATAVAFFAYSAARQNMTSLHMNYFSVLPPLDFVLQKILLRLPLPRTRRTYIGIIINTTPQILALLSRDWNTGFEAVPVAVMQTLWSYVIFLEQAATETTAWLSTIYVAFLFSIAFLLPVTVASSAYFFYFPSDGEVFSSASVAGAFACIIGSGLLFMVFFLSSGFLIKCSSSAQIVVLVSTASAILICLWHSVLPLWVRFVGLSILSVAWSVYVK